MAVTDIRIEPMQVTFGFGGTALDLGLMDGEISWAYEEQKADITAHQEGTNIIGQLRTGESHTATMTLKETDLENLQKVFQGGNIVATQILIESGVNDDIDFNEGAGSLLATLDAGSLTPAEVCADIATKMTAAAVATISCAFSSSTNLFTISSDGGTFELEWNTGANVATSVASSIGYDTDADDTGSTSYVSDTAILNSIGFGSTKQFLNTFDDADELNLHPVRLDSSDKSKDLTFWKSYISPAGLTFSGEGPLQVELEFTVYPDPTKDSEFRFAVLGDPDGFR